MKKRFVALLIVLCLVAELIPAVVNAERIDTQFDASSIVFDREYRTGYVGYSESIYVTTSESYTMISSDETIVSLDWDADSNHYWLNFNKTGTAILTATTAGGQTAQCTVEVKEMQHISLNDFITVTLQPNDRATYIFDYTTYGEYVLFSDDTSTEVWLAYSTKDTPQTSFSRNKSYITLNEESEFCHLTLLNKHSTPQQFSVCLMEAVPIESMTLDLEITSHLLNIDYDCWYPEDTAKINLTTYPINAKDERITYMFSDESVASKSKWPNEIDIHKEGTTVITAVSESGATTSYTLTVSEPKSLDLGEYDAATLSSGKRIQYCFTPEESGQYCFYGNEYFISCDDHFALSQNAELIQEYWHNGVRAYVVQMNANETYRIEVGHICFENDEHEITTNVIVQKLKPLESIELISEPTDYWKFDGASASLYSGNRGRISVYCPVGTALDTFTWSSSDESVVTINTDSYDPVNDDFNGVQVGVCAQSPGSATITVTSESGCTASFDVTVLEYTEYSTNYGRSAKWAKSSNSDFSIEIAAPVEKFLNLVCYQPVPDTEYYSIATGSSEDTTLITFENDFLQTLPSGYCVMYFNFTDGYAYVVLNIVDSQFTDVPADSFYYDPVMWAIEKNITNGLTATEFGPNVVCNRAQVVTFLWRAAGSPEPTAIENPFVDVQSGSFYEKPVLWAVEKGITTGTDAAHFSPNAACNRATVVTFLYRAAGSPAVQNADNPFRDVPARGWYTKPVLWALENDITKGISSTEFGPNTSCNRAQVVTFLYRAYN